MINYARLAPEYSDPYEMAIFGYVSIRHKRQNDKENNSDCTGHEP
jgi:hypothetical protein